MEDLRRNDKRTVCDWNIRILTLEVSPAERRANKCVQTLRPSTATMPNIKPLQTHRA